MHTKARINDRRGHVRTIKSLRSQPCSPVHPSRFGHAAADRNQALASRSKDFDAGRARARVRGCARHHSSSHRYFARRGPSTLAARPRNVRRRDAGLPLLVQACDKLGRAGRHDQRQCSQAHQGRRPAACADATRGRRRARAQICFHAHRAVQRRRALRHRQPSSGRR